MTPRRLSVLLTPAEIDSLRLDDTIVVIVDVLRSTSVIPVGLAAGATAFLPAGSVEDARALRDRMPSALLCGERDGNAPAGFDLGNSPLEYTPDRVRGRELVFTSTNGVPALLRTRLAGQVLTGAFVNESAILDVLLRGSEDVVLVAAGKEGRPSLEDVAFCGSLTARLMGHARGLVVQNDGAYMAQAIWKAHEEDVLGLLATSSHGVWLIAQGSALDLTFCARRDVVRTVPVFENDRLIPLVG
jgi:2-phosphosulfolactate phosphatase